jgi:WD40 repeat protein
MLWDTETGQQLASHELPLRGALPLAFSPDARKLATAGAAETVHLWDVATGGERAAFDWGIGPVYTFAFAPDGMTAAAAGRDFAVVIWDLDDLGP